MADAFAAIGSLADPVRRRLYEYVVSRGEGCGREEAARAAEVPVHTARFHLDRLVQAGLLTVDHRRLTGRSGPGAGRPAKVYSRCAREVSVSLPERGYELVGALFAASLERSLRGEPIAQALAAEARDAGARDAAAHDLTGGELERCATVLAGRGYEPASDDGGITLRNCPFDTLARAHPALVCGVNLDYVGGVLEGLGCSGATARLDPGPEHCCVRVESSAGA